MPAIFGFLFLLALSVRADLFSMKCGGIETRDHAMGLCMPMAMDGVHKIMLRENGFGVYNLQQGPRGRGAFAAPNLITLDIGRSVENRNYVNLDVAATFEKWTYPYKGYPQLLQTGLRNSMGDSFVDSQHPRSSPIMGLTLSDNIRLNDDRDFIKVFFAPRGESTDGPISFMRRAAGIVNPDAPLGRHGGQDMGLISSTVFGASLGIEDFRFEASIFNGQEPEPQKIELPLGVPNSGALRVMYRISEEMLAMVSAAYVKNSDHISRRYSFSFYREDEVFSSWKLFESVLYSAITNYEGVAWQPSAAIEFLLMGPRPRVWGRFEFVNRTPAQLAIDGNSNAEPGKTVSGLTLGYTHCVAKLGEGELGLGASFTKNFVPFEYSGAYGGNPWTGRVFLQAGGMQTWDW